MLLFVNFIADVDVAVDVDINFSILFCRIEARRSDDQRSNSKLRNFNQYKKTLKNKYQPIHDAYYYFNSFKGDPLLYLPKP